MTEYQRAYDLIDQLPEDSVHAVIEVMIRMLPDKTNSEQRQSDDGAPLSEKRQAFLRMEELRKEMAKYQFAENDRAEALEEK